MDHKSLFAVLLSISLSAGCVVAHVHGGSTMIGVGKVSAEHCVAAEDAAGAAEVAESTGDAGCTKIKGQGLTEGFVNFLSDALMLIPRMLAGAAAGAATTN